MQLSFGIETPSTNARVAASAISGARQAGHEALRDAIDEVRQRFGRTALGSLSDLGPTGVDPATQRGRAAFGPEPSGYVTD